MWKRVDFKLRRYLFSLFLILGFFVTETVGFSQGPPLTEYDYGTVYYPSDGDTLSYDSVVYFSSTPQGSDFSLEITSMTFADNTLTIVMDSTDNLSNEDGTSWNDTYIKLVDFGYYMTIEKTDSSEKIYTATYTFSDSDEVTSPIELDLHLRHGNNIIGGTIIATVDIEEDTEITVTVTDTENTELEDRTLTEEDDHEIYDDNIIIDGEAYVDITGSYNSTDVADDDDMSLYYSILDYDVDDSISSSTVETDFEALTDDDWTEVDVDYSDSSTDIDLDNNGYLTYETYNVMHMPGTADGYSVDEANVFWVERSNVFMYPWSTVGYMSTGLIENEGSSYDGDSLYNKTSVDNYGEFSSVAPYTVNQIFGDEDEVTINYEWEANTVFMEKMYVDYDDYDTLYDTSKDSDDDGYEITPSYDYDTDETQYKVAYKFWGYIKIPEDTYSQSTTFYFGIRSDDGNYGYIYIDGEEVDISNSFGLQGSTYSSEENEFELEPGKYYPIYLEYFNWGGGADFRLYYSTASSGDVDSGTWDSSNQVPASWFYPSKSDYPTESAEAKFYGTTQVQLPTDEGVYFVATKLEYNNDVKVSGVTGGFEVIDYDSLTITKTVVNNESADDSVSVGTDDTFIIRYTITPKDWEDHYGSDIIDEDADDDITSLKISNIRLSDDFPSGVEFITNTDGEAYVDVDDDDLVIDEDSGEISLSFDDIEYTLNSDGTEYTASEVTYDIPVRLTYDGTFIFSSDDASILKYTDIDQETQNEKEFNSLTITASSTATLDIISESPDEDSDNPTFTLVEDGDVTKVSISGYVTGTAYDLESIAYTLTDSDGNIIIAKTSEEVDTETSGDGDFVQTTETDEDEDDYYKSTYIFTFPLTGDDYEISSDDSYTLTLYVDNDNGDYVEEDVTGITLADMYTGLEITNLSNKDLFENQLEIGTSLEDNYTDEYTITNNSLDDDTATVYVNTGDYVEVVLSFDDVTTIDEDSITFTGLDKVAGYTPDVDETNDEITYILEMTDDAEGEIDLEISSTEAGEITIPLIANDWDGEVIDSSAAVSEYIEFNKYIKKGTSTEYSDADIDGDGSGDGIWYFNEDTDSDNPVLDTIGANNVTEIDNISRYLALFATEDVEDPTLLTLIEELTDDEGSEFYYKTFTSWVEFPITTDDGDGDDDTNKLDGQYNMLKVLAVHKSGRINNEVVSSSISNGTVTSDLDSKITEFYTEVKDSPQKQHVVDTIAPVISNASLSKSDTDYEIYKDGDTFSFSFDVSDNNLSEDSSSDYEVDLTLGSNEVEALAFDTSSLSGSGELGISKDNHSISSLTSNGDYSLTAEVTDLAGNTVEEIIGTITYNNSELTSVSIDLQGIYSGTEYGNADEIDTLSSDTRIFTRSYLSIKVEAEDEDGDDVEIASASITLNGTSTSFSGSEKTTYDISDGKTTISSLTLTSVNGNSVVVSANEDITINGSTAKLSDVKILKDTELDTSPTTVGNISISYDSSESESRMSSYSESEQSSVKVYKVVFDFSAVQDYTDVYKIILDEILLKDVSTTGMPISIDGGSSYSDFSGDLEIENDSIDLTDDTIGDLHDGYSATIYIDVTNHESFVGSRITFMVDVADGIGNTLSDSGSEMEYDTTFPKQDLIIKGRQSGSKRQKKSTLQVVGDGSGSSFEIRSVLEHGYTDDDDDDDE